MMTGIIKYLYEFQFYFLTYLVWISFVEQIFLKNLTKFLLPHITNSLKLALYTSPIIDPSVMVTIPYRGNYWFFNYYCLLYLCFYCTFNHIVILSEILIIFEFTRRRGNGRFLRQQVIPSRLILLKQDIEKQEILKQQEKKTNRELEYEETIEKEIVFFIILCLHFFQFDNKDKNFIIIQSLISLIFFHNRLDRQFFLVTLLPLLSFTNYSTFAIQMFFFVHLPIRLFQIPRQLEKKLDILVGYFNPVRLLILPIIPVLSIILIHDTTAAITTTNNSYSILPWWSLFSILCLMISLIFFLYQKKINDYILVNIVLSYFSTKQVSKLALHHCHLKIHLSMIFILFCSHYFIQAGLLTIGCLILFKMIKNREKLEEEQQLQLAENYELNVNNNNGLIQLVSMILLILPFFDSSLIQDQRFMLHICSTRVWYVLLQDTSLLLFSLIFFELFFQMGIQLFMMSYYHNTSSSNGCYKTILLMNLSFHVSTLVSGIYREYANILVKKSKNFDEFLDHEIKQKFFGIGSVIENFVCSDEFHEQYSQKDQAMLYKCLLENIQAMNSCFLSSCFLKIKNGTLLQNRTQFDLYDKIFKEYSKEESFILLKVQFVIEGESNNDDNADPNLSSSSSSSNFLKAEGEQNQHQVYLDEHIFKCLLLNFIRGEKTRSDEQSDNENLICYLLTTSNKILIYFKNTRAMKMTSSIMIKKNIFQPEGEFLKRARNESTSKNYSFFSQMRKSIATAIGCQIRNDIILEIPKFIEKKIIITATTSSSTTTTSPNPLYGSISATPPTTSTITTTTTTTVIDNKPQVFYTPKRISTVAEQIQERNAAAAALKAINNLNNRRQQKPQLQQPQEAKITATTIQRIIKTEKEDEEQQENSTLDQKEEPDFIVAVLDDNTLVRKTLQIVLKKLVMKQEPICSLIVGETIEEALDFPSEIISSKSKIAIFDENLEYKDVTIKGTELAILAKQKGFNGCLILHSANTRLGENLHPVFNGFIEKTSSRNDFLKGITTAYANFQQNKDL